MTKKAVLILGANSDVARATIPLYVNKGYYVMACSRNLASLLQLQRDYSWTEDQIYISEFDTSNFDSHLTFYKKLPFPPTVVLYAAGNLSQNDVAINQWENTSQMIQVNYAGAVSILNIIARDQNNKALKRIIGISSLSGVRGRKSNFIYGSTKSAFTTYFEGLRQYLSSRKIIVNIVISGYIRTKINTGLKLSENLMLEPEFVANQIVNATTRFKIIPGIKWKIIYLIVKYLPRFLLAKLP